MISAAALKDHLIQALATAALLGGGATVIQSKVDNARQDTELASQRQAMEAIPEIQKDVRATREDIAAMKARQEAHAR
jgi:hypothetical protein